MATLPRIDVPVYDMIIPSNGEKVKYRPYLVKEEKILMIALETADENQIEVAVLEIIEKCVKTKINIQKLTSFDVEYIFLKLRSKSVGEKIKLKGKCQSCEESNNIDIDLEKIHIKNEINEKDMRIDLGNSIIVDIHYPLISEKLTSKEKENSADAIINTVSKSIDTLYYGEDTYDMKTVPFQEVIDFVESLNTKQFQEITGVLSNGPYVSYDIKFKCKECGEDNDKELKGLIDFFI
jgi:ribosomal protein L44E